MPIHRDNQESGITLIRNKQYPLPLGYASLCVSLMAVRLTRGIQTAHKQIE
jgi:hypothetical protein